MEKNRANLCEEYIRDAEKDTAYYDIFFQMCRKFHVEWPQATEKEKEFISEITRVTYERSLALQAGRPLDTVRPAFTV